MTTPTHITTSGGLISAAFVENVREVGSRQRGVDPASFAVGRGASAPWSEAPKHPAALEETIATAWELLLERWDAVRNDLGVMDISQVRSRWLLPLFELLDFSPIYLRGDTVLDEAGKLRFPLSHRGWDGKDAPVLHTVIPSQDLDGRMAAGRGASTGSTHRVKANGRRASASPHDMLQAFLNASPTDHWAMLSNGILLRLLRDYHHTFTKGYVQFDLESIFETRNYGDFRALYRLCHASRFIPPLSSPPLAGGTEGGLPPLEQFYKDSIATGVRIGEDLRGQVRQAIEMLGNGFLDGMAQGDSVPLIRRLQQDEALCKQYYGEILHIIYRVLFLLFAEQRGMMPGRNSLYAEAYSIGALRARAESDVPLEDDFTDLWHGLQVTFRMVREGVEDLGVFGYDGMLFDEDQTPLLNGLPSPSQGEGPGVRVGIRNSDLLRAVRALTLIEREGVLQRISYADLGVEELGSIYESLLDFTPRVTVHAEDVNGREVPAHTFFLDPRGSERKTTGSYYTHPSLVNELIKSALLPVARDRLAAAGLPVIEEDDIGEVTAGLLTDYAGLTDAQRAAGAKALLSITVCDPAVGSGHFLVKANNALGAELARIRSGDEYPAEVEVQAAKRDVLAHCIYAVDLNPMAVELCKVSLWINASVADRPLSFLDHHIKCGNSLIGATPALMDKGVPYEAFDPGITGNDRDVANRVRAQSRKEQQEFEQGGGYQMGLFRVRVYEPTGEVREEYQYMDTLAEDQPRAARERYVVYLTTDEVQRRKLEADCWTAAFFWPLTKDAEWAPTFGEFQRLRDEGPEALPTEALERVEALAEQYRFFHWHLEFPDVFTDSSSLAGEEPWGRTGFDVILSNPPWEKMRLEEREFFAGRDDSIANARTTATRKRLIQKLREQNPVLHKEYLSTLRASDCTNSYLRGSGRYPLTSRGDINSYAIFAGLARGLVGNLGQAGLITPSGIVTDYTYSVFFQDLMRSRTLSSLYDFENTEGIFPSVDRNQKFVLLTMAGLGGGRETARFVFAARNVDDLNDPERLLGLGDEDIELINPNTKTCPTLRTRTDARIVKRLYQASPVLEYEGRDGGNPWGVSFGAMFHMSGDSDLFYEQHSLEEAGYVAQNNRYIRNDSVVLPLYEAKMMHQYDHRFAKVVPREDSSKRRGKSMDTTPSEHRDPSFSPSARYWVKDEDVVDRYGPRQWFIGFRNVTGAVANIRTSVFAILPRAGFGHSLSLILPHDTPGDSYACALLANFNSLVLDFVVRQKIAGINLSFFIVKQLPILPPSMYKPTVMDFIIPRVVELTYTAWDLQPFAQDVLAEVGEETWARWFEDASTHTSPAPAWAAGPTPAPFIWDEERRAVLRAELDALYAHLYGLTREELDYILDTFPIVRRKDEAQYGEYRTKRMVLEKYEALKEQFG